MPEGLLLRPAIPSDEIFQSDGTYGPKANFKISLRELPEDGDFRVKVKAARYDDALMLSSEARCDSIPGLEIEADDVRCTHGATTGRVDEEPGRVDEEPGRVVPGR